jgi:hypothetical protein
VQLWNYANGAMIFGTNSSERMRIDSNGNVGIGTNSPGRPLVVTADASGIPLRVHRNVNTIGWGTGINWAFNNSVGSVTDYAYVNSAIVSNTAGSENGTLGFFTVKSGSMTQQAIIDQNGFLGIGTTTPSNFLHVNNTSSILAGLRVDAVTATVGSGGALVLNTPSGSNHLIFETSGVQKWVQYISGNDMRLYSAGDRMTLQGNGNVGIGLTNPQYKLDVAGNINSSGTITGDNIVAKYQDVAEWVPSSEQVPVGTVVVLDTTKSNQVISSTVSYDMRVAGVVSERPGLALGEEGAGKVLVATTGRVLVKVDASHGPIHIGDLLVTSDMPGLAMKSEPVNLGGVQLHRPGTLIGKALEPLEKGSGKILVLLSLQ